MDDDSLWITLNELILKQISQYALSKMHLNRVVSEILAQFRISLF